MTPRFRFFFFLFCVIAFLISAPLLLLYTMGWRYNWQRQQIEKVGVLILDAQPPETELWLNDAKQSTHRPLRLADLQPNNYQIRATAMGYFPWQKTVEVKSQESLLFYDITLFKKFTTLFSDCGGLRALALDNTKKELAFVDGRSLWLEPVESGGKQTLLADGLPIDEPVTLTWSPDNNQLLVSFGSLPQPRLWLISRNKTALELSSITKQARFENVFWGRDSGTLYAQTNDTLLEINTETKTNRPLLQGIVSAAWLDNSLYLTKNITGKSLVYKYQPLNILKPLQEIAALPFSSYSLHSIRHDLLTILDENGKNIYLVDLADKKQPLLRLDGRAAVWGEGDKNDYLYYHDGAEISLFDPGNKKTALLLRYSGGVKKVLPLPDLPYFLFQLNQDLNIAELDDRDTRQVFTLSANTELRDWFLDQPAKQIIGLAKQPEGWCLSSLEIR